MLAAPVLLVACAVLFTVLGGRKAYFPLAVALAGTGVFMVGCVQSVTAAVLYGALFSAFAGLLALLFLIPCPRKQVSREEKQRSRDEAIYKKFHTELEVSPEENTADGDEPVATAEECGTCLNHVTTLLMRLKKEKLTAADRLEAEALTRTVEGYRGKTLSEKELRLVNDCLASVLKLTAKYKL